MLVTALMVASASARRTDEGTFELGGSLMIDSASFYGTEIALDLNAGQYIETGTLIGGFLAVSDNDFVTTVSGGAMGKYHFLDDGQTPFSPYVGAELGGVYATTEADDATALVLGGKLGFDYFLTENVALDVSANLRLATDDVYSDEDGLTNTDITVTVGLAFFF